MKYKVFFKFFLLFAICSFIILSCGKNSGDLSRPSDMGMNIRFSPAVLGDLKTGQAYSINFTISKAGIPKSASSIVFVFGSSNTFERYFEYDFEGSVLVSANVYEVLTGLNVGSASKSVSLARGQTVTAELVIDITVNNPPKAVAGDDISGTVGVPVTLDASGSTDKENDPLSYVWALTSYPPGLTQPEWILKNTAQAQFTPAVAGKYIFMLLVYQTQNTIKLSSDTLTLTVAAAPDTSPAFAIPNSTALQAGQPRSISAEINLRLPTFPRHRCRSHLTFRSI